MMGHLITMKDMMEEPNLDIPEISSKTRGLKSNQSLSEEVVLDGKTESITANPGTTVAVNSSQKDPLKSMEDSIQKEISGLSDLPGDSIPASSEEKPFGFAPPEPKHEGAQPRKIFDKNTKTWRVESHSRSSDPIVPVNSHSFDPTDKNDSYETPRVVALSPPQSNAQQFSPHPVSVSEQFHSAQLYAQKQDWIEALRHYQAVANLAPNSFETMMAYHQSARIYVKMGYLKKANYLYEVLINRFPQYRFTDQVLLENGRLYAKQENWQKAHNVLQTLYKQYPRMRNQVTPHLYFVEKQLSAGDKNTPTK
jgi:TolA-binding protein